MTVRLVEEMSQAVKEEHEHAIETHDYHQGVPDISVVADAKVHTSTLEVSSVKEFSCDFQNIHKEAAIYWCS